MDIEAFMKRIVQAGLSYEQSIVAFHNEKPVGIIMNGFRDTKQQGADFADLEAYFHLNFMRIMQIQIAIISKKLKHLTLKTRFTQVSVLGVFSTVLNIFKRYICTLCHSCL